MLRPLAPLALHACPLSAWRAHSRCSAAPIQALHPSPLSEPAPSKGEPGPHKMRTCLGLLPAALATPAPPPPPAAPALAAVDAFGAACCMMVFVASMTVEPLVCPAQEEPHPSTCACLLEECSSAPTTCRPPPHGSHPHHWAPAQRGAPAPRSPGAAAPRHRHSLPPRTCPVCVWSCLGERVWGVGPGC